MNFTNNIVCNNCTGARLYQQLGWEYNNPFMWCVIQPNDMLYLMNNWDSINFANHQLKQGILEDENKVKYTFYYTLIDDKVKLWWVHYIKNENCKEPTKVHIIRNNYDIHYCNIEDYINNKYTTRIGRMKDKPTFLVCKDKHWNFDTKGFSNQDNVLVIGEQKYTWDTLADVIIKKYALKK